MEQGHDMQQQIRKTDKPALLELRSHSVELPVRETLASKVCCDNSVRAECVEAAGLLSGPNHPGPGAFVWGP